MLIQAIKTFRLCWINYILITSSSSAKAEDPARFGRAARLACLDSRFRGNDSKIINTFHPYIIILILTLFISACSSSTKSILPTDGPTMSDIYQEQMQKSGKRNLAEIRTNLDKSNTPELVSTEQLDLNNQSGQCYFPQIPNPKIQMYVYPHLATADLAPIPGYTTEFFLYEKTYYAQAGEFGIC